MALEAWIKERGRELGFDRVGIAPAADLPGLSFFPEWLGRGYAGELDYLKNPKRRDARQLLPEARSVICCALNYDTAQPRSTEVAPDPERGWISRYAWGDDYHGVIERKLEALRAAIAEKLSECAPDPAAGAAGLDKVGFACKLYVDTGPVLERVYAARAGLGWQAKNTCLLDAELGSFFFLGVLVTNLELEPDAPLPDGCGACTLCLEACPTGALVAPYVMDARRCISYLTIELRSSIPEELRPGLGRHVFGCDVCQDVCPYNRRARVSDMLAFQPREIETRKSKLETRAQTTTSLPSPVAPATGTAAFRAAGAARLGEEEESASLFHPRLEWLASLDEEEFQQVFRASAVRRTKRRGLLRNALVAMGNSREPRFRPLLEEFAASGDSLLKEHADWALAQLERRAGPAAAPAGRSHSQGGNE